MMDDRRVLWAIVGTVVLVLAVVLLSPRVQQELRPEPVGAFLAFEVDGEGVARPGRVEVAAGTRFEIHAVLEARGLRGRRVFYTEAPGLEVDGVRIADEDLRLWKGPEEVKVLWFSVEGPRPFVKVTDEQSPSEMPFQAIFRPDWPRAWSIPGSVRPAREVAAGAAEVSQPRTDFGTQRYRVRLELFGVRSTLVPVATYESPGPDSVLERHGSFPTAVSQLGGALERPSRVFGLTQIEVGSSAPASRRKELQGLFVHDLAFTRILLLRALLDDAGVSWEDLEWRTVDLAAGPAWGAGSAAPGDLLRAGERFVVLYQDRGVVGTLDYADLCMDFAEGAKVLPLSDIFTGEGLVELTTLAPDRQVPAREASSEEASTEGASDQRAAD